MANKREHIARVKMTLERLHKCSAIHFESIPVTLPGMTAWAAVVERFYIIGHPTATKAYGWSEGTGRNERFFAVLELRPVNSAVETVKVSIAAAAKSQKA